MNEWGLMREEFLKIIIIDIPLTNLKAWLSTKIHFFSRNSGPCVLWREYSICADTEGNSTEDYIKLMQFKSKFQLDFERSEPCSQNYSTRN